MAELVKIEAYSVQVEYDMLEMSKARATMYLRYEATLADIRELAEALAKMKNVYDVAIFCNRERVPIRP